MAKLYNDGQRQPRSFEAAMTDVDLPTSVNYGHGVTEAQAVADLRRRVEAYITGLHDLDFTVVIR